MQVLEKRIIAVYQPTQLTTDELTRKVEAGIIYTGATNIKQMGAVMGYLSKNYAGLFDGAVAKDIVLSKLQD